MGESTEQHYAHTLEGRPSTEWEPLDVHLRRVSELAEQFAGAFGAAPWGRVLGLWHDLGKYSQEFTDYLTPPDAADDGDEGKAARVDHSTFGARHAARTVGGARGQILAFAIAGHHAGLPDATTGEVGNERSTLKFRLSESDYRIPLVELPCRAEAPSELKLPFKPRANSTGFQVAFFTRMLFSCLVDADRLATEAFCNPEIAAQRASPPPSLTCLLDALASNLNRLQSGAPPTTVNRARSLVRIACEHAAAEPPGFFSLNVPTGGGKTLASLLFALKHAEARGLKRVVVAIPFTSIIEQTADVYRGALGGLADRGLVEHHSNLDAHKATLENKLASENWDAPVIVTTNVQLYESLFAGAATPCRKLHRLARSVIVLDEAQTIPVELLTPTLEALKTLVADYNCSVVLCTATQPALEKREGFDIGLDQVRPIIADEAALFNLLKRVDVQRLGKLGDDELAQRLSDEASVLCIVNTRPHARAIYDRLASMSASDDCFHLSTLMCARHRRNTLAIIRARLKQGKSCRLVSTQLIEAGVDVDFPVVYRAPAGFDSVAQAAGRCNREGLREAGRVCLFDTESPPPAGLLRWAAECARELDAYPNPILPEAITAYFRLFYWSQSPRWDKKEIMACFPLDPHDGELRLKFRTAGERYRIIDNAGSPVLVPYASEGKRLCDSLIGGANLDYSTLRDAQQFLVQVPANMMKRLEEDRVLVEHSSGLWVLCSSSHYSEVAGLGHGAPGMDPFVV